MLFGVTSLVQNRLYVCYAEVFVVKTIRAIREIRGDKKRGQLTADLS